MRARRAIGDAEQVVLRQSHDEDLHATRGDEADLVETRHLRLELDVAAGPARHGERDVREALRGAIAQRRTVRAVGGHLDIEVARIVVARRAVTMTATGRDERENSDAVHAARSYYDAARMKKKAKPAKPAAKKKPASKPRKPAAKRMSPKPRADFGKPIDDFFAKQPPPLRAIATELRSIIEATVPGASSSMKWGMPFFSVDGKMVCAIGAHKAHVSLILSGPPNAFADPKRRLTGEAKGGRRLNLTSVAELPRKEVQGWVRTAAKLARG